MPKKKSKIKEFLDEADEILSQYSNSPKTKKKTSHARKNKSSSDTESLRLKAQRLSNYTPKEYNYDTTSIRQKYSSLIHEKPNNKTQIKRSNSDFDRGFPKSSKEDFDRGFPKSSKDNRSLRSKAQSLISTPSKKVKINKAEINDLISEVDSFRGGKRFKVIPKQSLNKTSRSQSVTHKIKEPIIKSELKKSKSIPHHKLFDDIIIQYSSVGIPEINEEYFMLPSFNVKSEFKCFPISKRRISKLPVGTRIRFTHRVGKKIIPVQTAYIVKQILKAKSNGKKYIVVRSSDKKGNIKQFAVEVKNVVKLEVYLDELIAEMKLNEKIVKHENKIKKKMDKVKTKIKEQTKKNKKTIKKKN